MKSDVYQTIATEQAAETKIKGSRFIAESFMANSSEIALEKLKAVKKREHSATHHCFAWITGLGQARTFKYSDDGEPNGSAGKPIYDQIAGKNLTNTLIVVTRYYGGTKLGTGGLVRAYSETAALALEKSSVKKHFLTSKFRTSLEFSQYDQWTQLLNRMGATVVDSEFAENVTLKIEIRQTMAEQLQAEFTELTRGKGKIKLV